MIDHVRPIIVYLVRAKIELGSNFNKALESVVIFHHVEICRL